MALVGYGGGGSHVGIQLAHLGFKSVQVYDPDIVEESNLNRLIGATAEDVVRATPKTTVARRVIKSVLPSAAVACKQEDWENNILNLRATDVLIGCVDSFAQRAALERFSRRFQIPYVDIGMDVVRKGDAFEIIGQVALSLPHAPCLRCMGIINDEMIGDEERARQYGEAGPKPQVVWPNGVLASTAVGLLVQLFCPWTGQSVQSEHLEYRGSCGELRRAPRLQLILKQGLECDHYRGEEVGDPLFGLALSGGS